MSEFYTFIHHILVANFVAMISCFIGVQAKPKMRVFFEHRLHMPVGKVLQHIHSSPIFEDPSSLNNAATLSIPRRLV